ncbi:replication factor A protein 3 [Saitoella complicata NRRL Y-17804]|uniref:replication factor A protein 3 n=1 Tax=Saitoella complicata (strain BCRC 22490 / CBS 7301 / JCM 7358 / NBRC 10748 / NRRL Y-17804) TaxID=698492 RepID=UPI0008674D74|nr:replication factor A protein 3 [Saitoella complicata NRRL Y-17804]ODQ55103.1 replication factor A protein 3 [Saitoella complicata NRRL Y-17804]
MTQAPTPRVNASTRSEHVGSSIRIIGKVNSAGGGRAIIDAGGDVEISYHEAATLITPGRFVEILGKVNQDLTVTCLTAIDFGEDLDMSIVDNVVQVSQQYRDIFY